MGVGEGFISCMLTLPCPPWVLGSLSALLTCPICFQDPWRAEAVAPLLGGPPGAARWTGLSWASWETPSLAPRRSPWTGPWSRGVRM